MPDVAPVAQHFIRWVDPESGRVVKMERLEPEPAERTDRVIRLAAFDQIGRSYQP